MKLLNLLLLIIIVALVIFAALNWQAIITPVPLALLFTNAEAPLGLILLAVTGLLTLLFLAFVIYLQSSTLMTRRRLNKDLATQRELAEKAEVSRISELRSFLETRLVEIETTLQGSVEETGKTLSAYIGELEDRLEKK